MWKGGLGVEGRLEEASRVQADQPEATVEPAGTIRVKLVKMAPNINPPLSNVILGQSKD